MNRASVVVVVLCMTASSMSCKDNGRGGSSATECGDPPYMAAPSVPDAGTYDLYSDGRLHCGFGAGATVEQSVGPDAPKQLSPALKHVIIILRENRSYDHLLGAYGQPDLGTPSNPDASAPHAPGEPLVQVKRFHESHYCVAGPGHDWSDVHLQYDNGLLDGFVAASNHGDKNNGGCVAMGYYNAEDEPLYYWLAQNFAISQNYHASLLGPTVPNLLYYFYATSCGNTENNQATVYHCPASRRSIFDALDGHYAVYSDSFPKSLGAAIPLTDVDTSKVYGMSQLATDVANNDLADVVFIEPNYAHSHLGTQNDEHPPSNIQDGETFVYGVLSKLMRSPAWPESVVFITWDEHGGYYDHVTPPAACPPEPGDPNPKDFGFDQLGIRTPFFAISPFARKGYISHYTADHTSILRFIEAWKGLGALSNRDANAWPLLDMFDFSGAARTDIGPGDPSAILAIPSIDPAHVAGCGTSDATSCCNTPQGCPP